MKNSIWSNVGWTKREIGSVPTNKTTKIIEESKKPEFEVDERFEDSPEQPELVEEKTQIDESVKKSKQQLHKEMLDNYNKKNQQKFIVESRYM